MAERIISDYVEPEIDLSGLRGVDNSPAEDFSPIRFELNSLLNLRASLIAEGRDLDDEDKQELVRLERLLDNS